VEGNEKARKTNDGDIMGDALVAEGVSGKSTAVNPVRVQEKSVCDDYKKGTAKSGGIITMDEAGTIVAGQYHVRN